MKQVILTYVVAALSNLAIGQSNNMIFPFCQIGDQISGLSDRFYCQDKNGLNNKFDNCSSHMIRFFPTSKDSLEIGTVHFKEVLLIEQNGRVRSIMLLNIYTDSVVKGQSISETNYELIKEYLTRKLKTIPEETTETTISREKVYGQLWTTNKSLYHLRKSKLKNQDGIEEYHLSFEIR